MKVAIVFTGSFRNLQDTYESIKHHLLNRFSETDVFFYGSENIFGVDSNLNFLNENFNLKLAIVNEKNFYNTFQFPNVSSNFKNSVSAFYNTQQGLKLKSDYEKKNNFEYDLVIRLRTDLFWFRTITDEEIDKAKSNVLIPWDWAFRSGPPWNGPYDFAVSDLYAISNSKLMDIYGNCYDYISDFTTRHSYHPEGLLGYYLSENAIRVEEVIRHVIMEYPIIERNGINSDGNPLPSPYYHPKMWNGNEDFGTSDVLSTNKFGFALHNMRLRFDK